MIDESILVNSDMMRIEQVLTNYLTNALNHIDEKNLLKIYAAECGKKIRISIFNSGKHIPEKSLNRIFTSFYKWIRPEPEPTEVPGLVYLLSELFRNMIIMALVQTILKGVLSSGLNWTGPIENTVKSGNSTS